MDERELRHLSREESLRLLSDVAMGRVVFTMHALPAIQPVNHVIDDGDIIIRTHLGTAITMAVDDRDAVVAYEADAIDPDDHLGWSVIIVGMARLIHDEGDITRYRRLLRPWASDTKDHLIRIRPELVNGFRLVTFSQAMGPKDP